MGMEMDRIAKTNFCLLSLTNDDFLVLCQTCVIKWTLHIMLYIFKMWLRCTTYINQDDFILLHTLDQANNQKDLQNLIDFWGSLNNVNGSFS